MGFSWMFFEMFTNIYIPHWLDSMPFLPPLVCEFIPIYIPHWLDSMVEKEGSGVRKRKIYIPHWLDSMTEKSPEVAGFIPFTFHTG